MEVGLKCNNFDSIEIDFMGVFVDMTGDLRAIVEHSNRFAENKRAVAMFDHDSKISCHVLKNTKKWIPVLSNLLHLSLTSTSDSFWKLGGQ